MIVRAVTFDVDGTLYDSRALRLRFILGNLRGMRTVRVARAVRQELRTREFPDGAGYMAAEAEEVAARLAIAPDVARREADRLLGPRLCAVLRKIGPRPDARESLERLVAAGLKVGVVSDYAAADKLEALGLADVPFGAVVAADACGALKPSPRAFLRAADALGVPPGAVVHVGDRADTDVAGAQAAGMQALLLGTGPGAALSLSEAVAQVLRGLDANGAEAH